MRMSAMPMLQISCFADAAERSWEATECHTTTPAGISRIPKNLFIVNAVPEDGFVFNYETARFFQQFRLLVL